MLEDNIIEGNFENDISIQNELEIQGLDIGSTPVEIDGPDEVEELNPYTPLGTFRIDENMPDELKKQLEKINHQSAELNNVMMKPVEADQIEMNVQNEEDEDYVDEEEQSIEDDIVEDDNVSEEIGDLF